MTGSSKADLPTLRHGQEEQRDGKCPGGFSAEAPPCRPGRMHGTGLPYNEHRRFPVLGEFE